jgi:tyrosyl-tRNA synthetase
MLQRDSVKKRLETDQGISFLEFSYQLFQAYDFLHLYKNHGCVAQIGGSDQWGNIASGIELVRKSTGEVGIVCSSLRCWPPPVLTKV